jgi:hypothetical protein
MAIFGWETLKRRGSTAFSGNRYAASGIPGTTHDPSYRGARWDFSEKIVGESNLNLIGGAQESFSTIPLDQIFISSCGRLSPFEAQR